MLSSLGSKIMVCFSYHLLLLLLLLLLLDDALMPVIVLAQQQHAVAGATVNNVKNKPFTILFDGDSVTYGAGAGIKSRNRHLALGQSYPYLIEARLGRYFTYSESAEGVRCMNYAETESTVDKMSERLRRVVPVHQPEVISVLIGVFDVLATMIRIGTDARSSVNRPFDVNQFESSLAGLIGEIAPKKVPSDTTIVMLGLPFVFNNTRTSSSGWQSKLSEIGKAIRSLATKFDFPVVDYYSKFLSEAESHVASAFVNNQYNYTRNELFDNIWESWSHDGIHPTIAAQHIMAEAWMQVFHTKVVPKLSKGRPFDKVRENALDAYVFKAAASSALNRISPTVTKASKMVIVFDGDSITDGLRDRTKRYNNRYLIGQGFPFILSGYLLGKSSADDRDYFKFHNFGMNSETVKHLEARWVRTMAHKPAIMHLLIGINDIRHAIANYQRTILSEEGDATESAAHLDYAPLEIQYQDLFSRARDSNPNGTIIVGTPFAYPGPFTTRGIHFSHRIGSTQANSSTHGVISGLDNTNWPVWQDSITTVTGILTKLAAQYKFPLINYQALFDKVIAETSTQPSVWVVDGVHPSPAGHHVMAEEILRVMKGTSKIVLNI
jgi:lysophospholipase L1-like esterase